MDGGKESKAQAPEPPALLVRVEAGPAEAVVAALRKAGLSVLAIDAQAPTDVDRTRALRVASKTSRTSNTSFQQVNLVCARDGRSAALVEGQVDFACLGGGLQPSRTAKMSTLGPRFRQLARAAFRDDRLLRLGRRPLPLVAGNETREATSAMVVIRRDTAAALDVLAEAMRQAVAGGLLP